MTSKIIHIIYLTIIVFLLIVYFFFPKEKIIIEREVEYIEGKKDTIVVMKTVYKEREVFISKPVNNIHQAEFNIKKDSAEVSGTVKFNLEEFIFENIKFKYPLLYVTKVDTIKRIITDTIEKKEPFYKNEYFYSSFMLLITLILSIIF
jgi:hypothetical protein